jgi:ABC-type multidrug transport system ATPase subunit
VVTAVLTQEVKELDDVADLRVIEVIEREKRSFNVGGKEFTAGQLVEQLGFTNQKQWTPVKDLSGGERRRLQLLRLLVGEPNVLMLDEPTNDLDTDTLAAVEDVLDGWPGTLVVVSHDRYLLERVTDHQMALLGDGKIRALPRGVDQYLELRESALAGSTITGGGNPVTAAGGGSGAGAGSAPAAGGASEAEKRDARKAKNRIDRQLGKLKQQEDKIHAQMTAGAGDASKFDELAGLNKKLQELAGEREALEHEWLEALEVLGE